MSEAQHISETPGIVAGIYRAVDLAREAAQVYSSTKVDTDHLLLGLLQERKKRKNIVAWCLGEFDVTVRKVREQIESMWVPDRRAGEELEFAFTPRLKSVVDQAWQEARQLGYDIDDDSGIEHLLLGTEHLLLALLEEPEGPAAQILSNLGVDRTQARQNIMRLLGVEGP
ncbi:MAG: Clp protease N-terminal domain-containing protein [Rubrobacteraceae bacterium]